MTARWLTLLVAAACALAGCMADEGDDESGSTGNNGTGSDTSSSTGSLVIKATYSGSPKSGGSGRLYAYVYASLSTAQAAPAYQVSTPGEAAVGTEYTLTVDGIAPGDYYVLVFYDWRQHNQNVAGNSDRYVLYQDQHLPAGAMAVPVAAGATVSLDPITFGDQYLLGSSGSYQ